MPTIKPFPTTVEHQRRLQVLAERRSAQRISDIEHGKKAWSEFQGARRKELDFEERKTIARNLWLEIEKYRGGKDGTLTQLLEKTEIELKHIGRVILAPDKSGNNELHPFPPKYIALMEALGKKTNEDINLLADRVLIGTHYHPESLVDLQDAQLILEALQVAVDQVDQEFNLWKQCKAIEEIRQPLERHYIEAVRRGDEDSATLDLQNEISEDSLPRLVGQPVLRWWPLEAHMLKFDFMMNTLGHIAPANAFWVNSKPNDSPIAAGVWGGESVLFFPNIYIGPTIEWRDGKPDTFDENHHLWLDIKTEPVPIVKFEENEYRVYLKNPEIDQMSQTDSIWDINWAMCMAARWLVIYPDPDAKRLIPALFCFGDFLATELIPLSARLIAEFGDSDRWQYLGHDAPTLLQRLRDLTGYGKGDFKVMDAWRETAARFHLNPIFKNHPGEAEKILYRKHLEKWIKDGRASMQRTSEVDE
jgi:hypothetical protein